MTGTPRTKSGRSALAAVVLSGIAPGAGHLYVGRIRRGAVLLALLAVTSLAWTTQAARSWSLARAFALPPLLLTLGIIVDAGRLARRAPRPFQLGSAQRWPVYAAVIAVTGFAAPTALAWCVGQQAALAQPGAAMGPWLQPNDLLVVDRRAHARSEPRRGEVVALRSAGAVRVARVVGLPGEKVAVRRGAVVVDGLPWPEDARRAAVAGRLSMDPTTAGRDEILVLPDRRAPGDGDRWRVPRSDVIGRARYVLLPADLAPERIGEPVR